MPIVNPDGYAVYSTCMHDFFFIPYIGIIIYIYVLLFLRANNWHPIYNSIVFDQDNTHTYTYSTPGQEIDCGAKTVG